MQNAICRLASLTLILMLASPFQTFAQPQKVQTRRDHPIQSISHYLHNTVRPDVGGEGLWMPQLDKKLTGWLKPQLGFVGDVYYVHATNLKGLFAIKLFDDQGGELKPEVVAHDWYPTHTVTKYRAGALEVIEYKFITDDEMAQSELVLTNLGKESISIQIKIEDLLEGTSSGEEKNPSTEIKRLRFIPTTHYFKDLTIEKFYRLQGSQPNLHSQPTLSERLTLYSRQSEHFIATLKFASEMSKLQGTRLSDFMLVNNKHSLALLLRENSFNAWFKQNVPSLSTSDAALDKMYYYRWYLVKKSHINTRAYLPTHPYPYPALYEGLAGTWFPKIIGLPIPMQILEARWLNDKRIAYDQARNALTKEDFFNYLNWTPYAFWQLHLVAPDAEFLKLALPAMRNFIKLEAAKDEDNDFLPSVFGSWITGMEYQPSFFYFTKPRWDHTASEEFKPKLDALSRDPNVYHQFTPLERVDEASYYYLNSVATARVARLLGEPAAAQDAEERAAKIKAAVDQKMWDARSKFFYDLEPTADEKALEAKVIVGFWPYLFGEMQDKEKLALFDHLINPKEFWTRFPVATASQDCPAFDPQGFWKVGPNASQEKPFFYEDSWNGPTWIFSEALAIETLGQAARMSRSPLLKTKLNELMRAYTRLQFVNGDLSLPCTVEHYNSRTGEPIRFLADYFHSFYNDLVIRYFAGIVPRADALIEIDPLIEGVAEFAIENVHYRNHRVSVIISARRGYRVSVDGQKIVHAALPRKIIFDPDLKRLIAN